MTNKNQRHQQRMERKKSIIDANIAKADTTKGLLLVLTGNGKGKSSSAFGMIGRALGHGLKVGVCQFIKSRTDTGEEAFFSAVEKVDWHVLGDGFTWDTKNPEQDIKTSREVWEFSQQKILSQDFDFVLLDEINYCCGYNWISGEEIANFISNEKPPWMHLVLTGRNAASEVIEVANTVTEMRKLKHAYSQGIKAEQGIEF